MREPELELRDRLLAPIAVRDSEGEVVGANLGALVRRLILFEQVVIDSYAMRELPALIDALGAEPFIELLQAGAVRIRADGWTYGEMGNGGFLPRRGNDSPASAVLVLPLVPRDREHHISLCLGEIRAMPLGKKTSQALRRAIVDALLLFPDNAGQESMESLPRDLTRNLNSSTAQRPPLSRRSLSGRSTTPTSRSASSRSTSTCFRRSRTSGSGSLSTNPTPTR